MKPGRLREGSLGTRDRGEWFAFPWEDICSAREWLIALGIVAHLCVLVLVWHEAFSEVGNVPVTLKLHPL